MNNKLAYLIVTYNGQETLSPLLSSIPTKEDVLIVDNASADNTLKITEQYGVRILKNDKNLGYGAAINQGLNELSETYSHVFVLNQDCDIEKLDFTFLDKKGTDDTTSPPPNLPPLGGGIFTEYAIVQPLILLPDGTVNVDKLVMNMLGYVYPINFGKPPPSSSPLSGGEMLYFSGAAFIINLEKFKKIGPFEASLFLYYEDVDYALQCWLAGEKICFEPGIVVTHHYNSFRQRPEKRKMLALNRRKIINRYFTARWKKWLWVKNNPLETARTTAEQKEALSAALKQEAVLGFHTRQFFWLQRWLINLFVVPYAWILKKIV